MHIANQLQTAKALAIYATSRRDIKSDAYGSFREETVAAAVWLLSSSCISLKNTTVGFLSRTIASYTFDETTRKRRDGIFAEGW